MEVILVEDLKKLNILFSFDSPHLKTVVLMNQTSEKLPEKKGVKGLRLSDSRKDLKDFFITPKFLENEESLYDILNHKSYSMG